MSLGCLILGIFTFVQFNCENLFDCVHDSAKQDMEFTAEGSRHWTRSRYWDKINNVGRVIISCGGDTKENPLPDIVALCEIENDSVMHDLTRRSLLRNAGYEYIVTCSPDVRGIDVSLLYRPSSFRVANHHALRVDPLPGMRPTRDILYVSGMIPGGDTLHVFVVHSPSRYGGEHKTRPYRMRVAERLCRAVDSLRSVCLNPNIIITGDFNDYSNSVPVKNILSCCDVTDISSKASGRNGAKGSYKYNGEWNSLDHVMVGGLLRTCLHECFIGDMDFLLEDDDKYGGKKPRRTYNGWRYNGGISDHLPVVVRFKL